MRVVVAMIAFAGVVACKGTGKPGAGSGSAGGGQTMHDAMAILCGAEPVPDWLAVVPPSDRQAAIGHWLDQRIHNPDARGLLASLSDVADRGGKVRAAARTAGITDCKPLAIVGGGGRVAGVSVPDVGTAGGATDELDQDLTLVTISATAVVVDGTEVIAVHDGTIDHAAAETLATHLRGAPAEDTGMVAVAIDHGLTIGLLLPVTDAVHRVGGDGIALIVTAGGTELRTLPVGFPHAATGAVTDPLSAVIGHGEVMLTGAVGTRIAVTPADAMRSAIEQALRARIASRGPDPGEEASRASVIADPATTVQTFADVVAGLRAAADGTPLFPTVVIGVPVPEPQPPRVR